ncbi:arginine N-succinyltransferase [Pseudomonas syringae pv. coryli]|uniref:Arginine N-succinyltransferase n=1 Tax=Pseudomonas syringae pv. coryli TaxID=317659 RepID=A0A0P9MP85_9PSED|nr:arginine N-succinyltransferase [Pseudomonas syringae pv. coryli]
MFREKLGGMNRKSYARNDNPAQASAGPMLLRTATSNTAARKIREMFGSASTPATPQATRLAINVATKARP